MAPSPELLAVFDMVQGFPWEGHQTGFVFEPKGRVATERYPYFNYQLYELIIYLVYELIHELDGFFRPLDEGPGESRTKKPPDQNQKLENLRKWTDFAQLAVNRIKSIESNHSSLTHSRNKLTDHSNQSILRQKQRAITSSCTTSALHTPPPEYFTVVLLCGTQRALRPVTSMVASVPVRVVDRANTASCHPTPRRLRHHPLSSP